MLIVIAGSNKLLANYLNSKMYVVIRSPYLVLIETMPLTSGIYAIVMVEILMKYCYQVSNLLRNFLCLFNKIVILNKRNALDIHIIYWKIFMLSL